MQVVPGHACNYAAYVYIQNFGHLFLRTSDAFLHPSDQPQVLQACLAKSPAYAVFQHFLSWWPGPWIQLHDHRAILGIF